MTYSDFSVTTGQTVSAGNQNQNMINIRHVVNGTNATAAPVESLVSLTNRADASTGLFENVVINPIDENMVDQYGNSGSTVANADCAIDRWCVTEDQTNNPTFTKGSDYIQLQANATQTTPGKIILYQQVEDVNYNRLKGEQVTFSCELITDNANARIVIYDGVTYTNSSVVTTADGSTVNNMSVTKTISASASSLTLYIGIQGDDTATTTIAASDFFQFRKAKLELGDTATAYKPRGYTYELLACQRYYGVVRTGWSGDTTNTESYRAYFSWPVEIRTAAPTLSYSTVTSAGFDNSYVSESLSVDGGAVRDSANTTANARLFAVDITYDAEL